MSKYTEIFLKNPTLYLKNYIKKLNPNIIIYSISINSEISNDGLLYCTYSYRYRHNVDKYDNRINLTDEIIENIVLKMKEFNDTKLPFLTECILDNLKKRDALNNEIKSAMKSINIYEFLQNLDILKNCVEDNSLYCKIVNRLYKSDSIYYCDQSDSIYYKNSEFGRLYLIMTKSDEDSDVNEFINIVEDFIKFQSIDRRLNISEDILLDEFSDKSMNYLGNMYEFSFFELTQYAKMFTYH